MTVKEFYILFQEDNPNIKIKLSTFYELRPKHVLLSSQMPHNVCICRYHANLNLIVESLHNKLKSYFPANDSELLIMDSEQCMIGMCKNCKNIESIFPVDNTNLDDVLIWKQW